MDRAEESISLEENLKKALTELLILQLLSQRAAYIGELTAEHCISLRRDLQAGADGSYC